MADISQITLPDGTTYDIKDPVARAAAGDAGAGKIFYGVSSTAAATQTKVVTIDDFELFTGALIAVKFENVNTATAPKLNISGTGAINMYSVGTAAVLPNAWSAGETLLFVYNGTSYMVADGGIASTSGYGATKLNSATDSTSTTEAATPSAVKTVYDLANSKQNVLTFDSTPTANSTNPVTSGGVHDALSSVDALTENFYAYTWRRYGKKYKLVYSANSLGTKVYSDSIGLGPTYDSYGTLSTMLISKKISIDSDGNFSLVNPTQYTVSQSNQNTINNNIANSYFQMKTLGSSNYISSGLNTTDIYFNENTSGTIAIQTSTVLLRTKDNVKVVSTEIDVEYSAETIVKSTNSSAYPNPNGWSGDYYYEYIGRLIDRVYESRPIAVVKYIGTGTYGSANPIEVTFPFAPRYVMVYGYRLPSAIYTSLINGGNSAVYNHPLDTNLLTTSYQAELIPSIINSSYRTYYYGKKSADGKTISWYSTQNSSSTPGSFQHNQKDYEYICVGIG